MLEPITLSAVSAVALTEGIKFLYEQAGEVLKRWRERKKAASKDTATNLPKETIAVKLPAIFEGQFSTIQIHFDVVEKLEKPLQELTDRVSGYADGRKEVDSTDKDLLDQIDAIRQILEAVYQQRITFKGEQRAPSGPVVEGTIDVESVAGRAAGVEAKIISSGRVVGTANAIRVEETGTLHGVKVDQVGE